jgi:ATP-dependent Zn protease
VVKFTGQSNKFQLESKNVLKLFQGSKTLINAKFKVKIHKTMTEIKEIVKRNSFMLFFGFSLSYLLFLKYKKKGKDKIQKDAAKKLLEPVKITEVENYVTRKEYEEDLNEIIGSLKRQKYVTLVGPKGSGKKTLLKHVLNGKKGIAFVKYDGETTMENFQEKLLEAINVQIEPWNSCNFYFLTFY